MQGHSNRLWQPTGQLLWLTALMGRPVVVVIISIQALHVTLFLFGDVSRNSSTSHTRRTSAHPYMKAWNNTDKNILVTTYNPSVKDTHPCTSRGVARIETPPCSCRNSGRRTPVASSLALGQICRGQEYQRSLQQTSQAITSSTMELCLYQHRTLSIYQHRTLSISVWNSVYTVDWKIIAIKNNCDFDWTLQIVNSLQIPVTHID